MSYAARKVLGLGGKLIITPPFTTATCLIRDKFERLARDVSLKVHFAGEEGIDLAGSKLFVKSTWMPPVPPIEVDSRVHAFNSKLRCMFVKKKARSNISKFQKGLLDLLRNDDDHIVAVADKGIGPVWVETPRYIRDALVHLANPETYQIISEAQGRRDSWALKWKIFEWTI